MSQIIKLFTLMSKVDKRWNYLWHTNSELCDLVWFNFKDKLLQLREKGCEMERQGSGTKYEWKLTYIPPTLITVKWKLKQVTYEQLINYYDDIDYNIVDSRKWYQKVWEFFNF